MVDLDGHYGVSLGTPIPYTRRYKIELGFSKLLGARSHFWSHSNTLKYHNVPTEGFFSYSTIGYLSTQGSNRSFKKNVVFVCSRVIPLQKFSQYTKKHICDNNSAAALYFGTGFYAPVTAVSNAPVLLAISFKVYPLSTSAESQSSFGNTLLLQKFWKFRRVKN